jgi:hypothetical protein
MVFSLETELQDHIENIEELNDEKMLNEILSEYLKNKTNDEEIDAELINAADKLDATDEERPDLDLLVDMQSIEDPITYELAQLVLRSDQVRIRTMHELEEAGLEDPILPNKWIYHKDSDLNEVLEYIVNEYDSFRMEDEYEYEYEKDNLR